MAADHAGARRFAIATNAGEVKDVASAEHALAALHRDRLLHSWLHSRLSSDISSSSSSLTVSEVTSEGVFEVVVGRGSVRMPVLDPTGVLSLAGELRRDRVTLTSDGYAIGYRTMRYRLSDGRFADRHDSRIGRHLDDFPYTAYVPGGDPSGCAAVSFAARTQKEALALAGLVRVRGRCARCRLLRPLHVRAWSADPTILCPGCGADARTPVILLCRICRQPITRTTAPDSWSRNAWHHTATGSPQCETTKTGQAQPG